MSSRKMNSWRPLFDEVSTAIEVLKKSYGKGSNDLEALGNIAVKALRILQDGTKSSQYDHWPHAPEGERFYDVFSTNEETSRPIRRDLFIRDPGRFEALWQSLCLKAMPGVGRLLQEDLSSILYTCLQSVASVYDLYRRSKKPPGTFLEVMVGSFAARISGLKRKAHIKLPKEGYKATTDIVIELQEGGPGLVLPCKMTTRERMVQVFAHQRLLDSVFGEGTYRSVLVCVSETQLDGRTRKVKEICVPTQVEMYQKYLAKLEGLYYLDPPAAYVGARFAQENFRPRLTVKDLSLLFSEDLALFVDQLKA